jgi:hypothetical protein
MSVYVISEPDKPWLTLFTSHRLDVLAEAIAAQPQIKPSSIYATLDGKPRSLTDAERTELCERVLELRPDSSEAAAGVENALRSDGIT